MKAVIMAGGFGTRLRPLTCEIPKPMVPMANRPMMHHIVRLLKEHGFDDIVSLLYYQPDIIRNYFGDGRNFGVKMQYMQAEADFGTAGSVRNAADKIGRERFIIISGDVLTDFDLTAILRSHCEKKADATIVLTRVKNPLHYGVVVTDDGGLITRFLEKPAWGEVFSDTVNTGIYILEPHVLDMVPYKQDYDFSRNLFPVMMSEGMLLHGCVAGGYWRDVGNLHEYQEASLDCISGRVAIPFEGELRGGAYVGEGSDAPVGRPVAEGSVVVGRNCRIAPSAQISRTVIGDGCVIGDEVRIHNCVLWDNVTVGDRVEATNSVIASRAILRHGARIGDSVFIGDEVVVGENAELQSNIKIWPRKAIASGAVLSKSLVWQDRWLKDLFTDSRITGSTNIEMNPEFGAKLGGALGAFVGAGRTVLASRDPDPSSRMMKRAVTSGLMSAGVSLFDLQTTPIPLVRQELRNGRAAAGFHIRKSPYDSRSMDIIFFDGDGKDLPTGKTKSIERLFFGEDYQRAEYNRVGTLHFLERTTESYRERFIHNLDIGAIARARFSVVLDYSNGIASTLFPNILGDFGCQVVSMNAYVDPAKLTRSVEEFQISCRQVEHIVTSLSYDAGFLIDAGAEKIFVTSERGHLLSDDRLLALVTRLFLETQRVLGKPVRKIAVPISATAEVDLIAAAAGVEVLRTPNTHSGMMNAALDHADVSFVGGTKGGFIFPEFLFATDGMFAVAKILEMMAVTGLRLGPLEDRIEKLHQHRAAVSCDWEAKGTVMRHAMRESEHHGRQLIDGIKILSDERTWVLLLPDKEYPLFHITAEAPTPEAAGELAESFRRKVAAWRDQG